ncbi:hypothetical protein DFP72DRAFT_889657 [Ephemerocybe angulata]|uniref:Uncharacterized protein n=1 Tax=Ephemerocybe angulata TaxID=980116 RepID=A0A8H6M6V6_9AGAR|nr:hypothetical protein DFP72DRAFT_889657 [Tulosesus angulatus]
MPEGSDESQPPEIVPIQNESDEIKNELDVQEADSSEREDTELGTDTRGEGCLEDSARGVGNQIFKSVDILPIILGQLRDVLESDDLARAADERRGWKGLFTLVLPINDAFFDAGANMLWNTMESIIPILKLLPWFKEPYQGVGGYYYSGSGDWKSFLGYASRVQRFHFTSLASINIEPFYLLELITLPGRPDPFFAGLQSLSFAPDACRQISPLTLFFGPSLKSMEILTVSELRGYRTLPADWNHGIASGLAASGDLRSRVLAAFPKLPDCVPNLTMFIYRGPTNEDFFRQIAKFTSITSLDLTLTAPDKNRHCLRSLRDLPDLQSLVVTILPCHDADYSTRLQTSRTACPRLRNLHITAKEGQASALVAILCPRPMLSKLKLDFITITDAFMFYYTLSACLVGNDRVESIAVRCVEAAGQPLSPLCNSNWKMTTSTPLEAYLARAKTCFGVCTNVQSVTFLDLPPSLWGTIFPVLDESMMRWKSLRTFAFSMRAGIGTEAVNNTIPTGVFPGLSFLATTVWMECPMLESLEVQLDEELVAQEDLVEGLKACGDPLAIVERYTDGHPLRELTINTGIEGRALVLDQKRKVQIVRFLESLFPKLVEVKGSSNLVWEEIGAWVLAYRELKSDVYSQIEAIL